MMDAPRETEPARILIVDDHEDNVELLGQVGVVGLHH